MAGDRNLDRERLSLLVSIGAWMGVFSKNGFAPYDGFEYLKKIFNLVCWSALTIRNEGGIIFPIRRVQDIASQKFLIDGFIVSNRGWAPDKFIQGEDFKEVENAMKTGLKPEINQEWIGLGKNISSLAFSYGDPTIVHIAKNSILGISKKDSIGNPDIENVSYHQEIQGEFLAEGIRNIVTSMSEKHGFKNRLTMEKEWRQSRLFS